MFDTPDFSPVCFGLSLAVLVGILVYAIGPIIENKLFKKRTGLGPFLAMIVTPFVCIASIALNLGVRSPAPWLKPTNGDVIGTWHLSPQTVNVLQEWDKLPVLDHEIVFKENGTFYLNNVPNFWRSLLKPQEGEEKYVNGSGTWNLDRFEEEWGIFARFQKLNISPDKSLIKSDPDKSLVIFYFEGYLPPYTIISIDRVGTYLRFQRK